MSWLKSAWFRLKNWMLGRRYVIGVDFSRDGDNSAWVVAYRDRKGRIVVTDNGFGNPPKEPRK